MVTETPPVAVVLVHHNAVDDLVRCVRSLQRSEFQNFRVVIVDNRSSRKHRSHLRVALREFAVVGQEPLTVLAASANRGFAAGNNIGIYWARESNIKYIWLLNADTEIHAKALSHLVQSLVRHSSVGAVGSKILYPQIEKSESSLSRIWSAGAEIDREACQVRMIGNGELDKGQYETEHECGYLPGCSVLVRMSAIETVGQMSERYFLYFEETDWFLRFRLHGWNLLYVPKSVVVHHFDDKKMQTPQTVYYYNRNERLFWVLYARGWGRLRIFLRALFRELPKTLRAYRQSKGTAQEKLFRAHFLSVTDFLLLKFGQRRLS